MNIEDIREHMKSYGWVLENSSLSSFGDFYWWKRFPDVDPSCQGNDGKPGVQICVCCWDRTNENPSHGYSFEIDMRAEPDDGIWVILKSYGLRENNIIQQLESQCQKLIRAWKACQNCGHPLGGVRTKEKADGLRHTFTH